MFFGKRDQTSNYINSYFFSKTFLFSIEFKFNSQKNYSFAFSTFFFFCSSSHFAFPFQQIEIIESVTKDINAKQSLNLVDLKTFLEHMKPELQYVSGVYSAFEQRQIDSLEEKEYMKQIFITLTHGNEWQIQTATRILQNLCSPKNQFQKRNLQLLLETTDAVKALFQKVVNKKHRPVVFVVVLDLLFFLSELTDGKEAIYQARGIDKLVLLLHNANNDTFQFYCVRLLARLYQEEKYRAEINLKSDLQEMQRIIDSEPKLGSSMELSRESSRHSSGIKHKMIVKTFIAPTWCKYCQDFIWGIGKNGFACSICSYPAHKKCVEKVPANCSGTELARRRAMPTEFVIDLKMAKNESGLFRNVSQEV